MLPSLVCTDPKLSVNPLRGVLREMQAEEQKWLKNNPQAIEDEKDLPFSREVEKDQSSA